MSAWLLCLIISSTTAPQHLVVLQHGLYGSTQNMVVLQQQLQTLGDGKIIAHLASSNDGLRTRDGVEQGGRRLAEEIRQVQRAYPSLKTLSLVGNSLGGLYVRVAAAELLDSCPLEPRVLVTTGAPHLGVRRFTYLPLPSWLYPAAPLVAGQTADDLLLRDDADGSTLPLLVRMAQPDSAYGAALRRFRKRRLYANLVGDFMVPFGTAAIEGGEYGAGIGDGRLARRFVNRPDASYRDESVCKGEASGVGVICEQRATIAGGEAGDYEEMMRSGLSTVSWEKVGVGFKGATTFTPLAHNKLPALRREGWRRAFEWVEKAYEGTGVMEHCARFIVEGLD